MEIVMPEDGWDDREISFWCEKCDRTVVAKSVYLNMDYLLSIGMTQVEFFAGIHESDHLYAEEAGMTLDEWFASGRD